MNPNVSFDSFPPHFRLMLRALHQKTTEDRGESTLPESQLGPMIREGIDWDEFLLCTRQHRVSTLVLNRLQAGAESGLQNEIPEFVMRELAQRAARNRFRTGRLMLEAARIHRHFEEAGLQMSTLKGAGLSSTIYGNPAARHTGDLDILLEPKDLKRGILLIEELGYKRINPACRMTARRLRIYERYWKDITFRNTATGIDIDLHSRLFNNQCFSANSLIEGVGQGRKLTRPAELASSSRVDQCLYCAVHGCHDGWIYLKGLADVANLIDLLSPSELDEVFSKAKQLNLLPQLSSAVNLATDWVGVQAWSPFLLPRKHSFHQAMLQTLVSRLKTSHYRPERRALPFFQEALHELRMTPTLASLRQIVERYVWRPRIWSIIDLPDSLLWIHPALGIIIPPRLDLAQATASITNSSVGP